MRRIGWIEIVIYRGRFEPKKNLFLMNILLDSAAGELIHVYQTGQPQTNALNSMGLHNSQNIKVTRPVYSFISNVKSLA